VENFAAEIKNIAKVINRLHSWQNPQGVKKLIAILTIFFLSALAGYLTYITGGTQNVYVHLMYIPIITSAFFFGIPGGIAAAVLADLILAPLPVNTATGQMQATINWLTRGVIFSVLGGFIGLLFHLLKQQVQTIENILQRLSNTYTQTLKSFASIVTGRDEQTGGHCERVALNACLIGKAMSLDNQGIEALYWSGLLHDLGKIAIPESVLLKPQVLTSEEMEIIRSHSQIGSEIIKVISPEFEQIAKGIASHHERWDGSGYPAGLKGEEIPVIGRILAIVDGFEALTSTPPYRSPLSSAEALNYLMENAGTHFDPNVVDVFACLFEQDQIFIQEHQDPPVTRFQTNLGSDIFKEDLLHQKHLDL